MKNPTRMPLNEMELNIWLFNSNEEKKITFIHHDEWHASSKQKSCTAHTTTNQTSPNIPERSKYHINIVPGQSNEQKLENFTAI